MLTKTDKKDIGTIVEEKIKKSVEKIVVNVVNEVMIPAMDHMADTIKGDLRKELASKEDLKEVNMKLDSLDRKFDSAQGRLDKHDQRIGTLEKLHPQGKHAFA